MKNTVESEQMMCAHPNCIKKWSDRKTDTPYSKYHEKKHEFLHVKIVSFLTSNEKQKNFSKNIDQ